MAEVLVDLTGAKILVVDDVPDNVDIVCSALEQVGYQVQVATDGTTALELIDRSPPDLVLLDVMMPGIDGFETCRRLKAKPSGEDVPVIFLTALEELESVLEGFRAGGIDYVTKPFRKEEVLTRVRTHLERARFAQELARMNAHLEEMVAERTRQLQLKVRELEGKDRIAQHLLTLHELDDTLELVLEVIAEITGVGSASVYLEGEVDRAPFASIGLVSSDESSDRQAALQSVRETHGPVRIVEPSEPSANPFALVPILQDKKLLGIIHVDEAVTEDVLETLMSFALQAAVAITDAQVQQDSSQWEGKIEEVLDDGDVVLDDVESVNALDNPRRGQ